MSTQDSGSWFRDLPHEAVRGVSERQQKLRQMVGAELTLMCSVAIKLGTALLVLEGLFRFAAGGYPPQPGAAAVAAGRPPATRSVPHQRFSRMHVTAPRQHHAEPAAR
jgi:hypothetical protein